MQWDARLLTIHDLKVFINMIIFFACFLVVRKYALKEGPGFFAEEFYADIISEMELYPFVLGSMFFDIFVLFAAGYIVIRSNVPAAFTTSGSFVLECIYEAYKVGPGFETHIQLENFRHLCESKVVHASLYLFYISQTKLGEIDILVCAIILCLNLRFLNVLMNQPLSSNNTQTTTIQKDKNTMSKPEIVTPGPKGISSHAPPESFIYSHFTFEMIVRQIIALMFIVFMAVIVDSFIIKYAGADYTIAYNIDFLRLQCAYLFRGLGYYAAKCANVLQIAWDVLEWLWENIKDFIPYEEFLAAKDLMQTTIVHVFRFLVIGWLRSIFEGVKDALILNWQIGLIVSLPITGLIAYKLAFGGGGGK